MATKHAEVTKWLSEVLGDSNVPPFEKTESNINKLHQLMISYKEAFDDVAKVKDYADAKSEVYEENYKYLKNNLDDLGISPNLLNTEEQKCLEALGSLYHDLNLQSTTPVNIILAINSLEDENRKIEEDFRKENCFTENLIKLSESIAQNMVQLTQMSAEADREVSKQEQEVLLSAEKGAFNQEKMIQYREDLKAFEAKLRQVGFEEELSLSSSSQKVDSLTEARQKLEDKTQTLESYTLPPDLVLAKVKIEELKQTLADSVKNIVSAYDD